MSIAIEQPTEADLDIIHGFLTETYWSPGIAREKVAAAAAHSFCAIARDESGALIGFARAVSDHVHFAWIADVMVLPQARGKGVARGMVAALMQHPEMQGLRRWLLATCDAHGVYAELGFKPLAKPERFMEITIAAPFGGATT